MAVRWPDGSFTGSVLATPAPTPAEPEPETQEPDAPDSNEKKKEADHGSR